jgi:hypothetical protein
LFPRCVFGVSVSSASAMCAQSYAWKPYKLVLYYQASRAKWSMEIKWEILSPPLTDQKNRLIFEGKKSIIM